jgi:hypothetical protein
VEFFLHDQIERFATNVNGVYRICRKTKGVSQQTEWKKMNIDT